MNYYKRHIGDYAKKAGHLSALEHGVYTLILDAYYDREQPPTLAEALRWARARNPDETQAVSDCLAEFFTLVDGRYIQQRVEDELAEAKALAERNRTNGKLGGRPPRKRKTQKVSSGLPEIRQSTNPLIQEEREEASSRKPKKAKGQTFAEWADQQSSVVAVDDPIYGWAESVSIPREWVAIAWWIFEARYDESDKAYSDWRAVFRKAVREDWLKAWRPTRSGEWELTTAGVQAQREMAV